jgi:hypothetical protein
MPNSIAYGFMQLRDSLPLTVEQIGVERVNDAILQTLNAYNEQLNALMGIFVQPVPDRQRRYTTTGSARLQPMDESGRALPIKPALGYYDVAFPLYMAGGAWGATFLERKKMTVEDANNTINVLISADHVWMRDHVLSALFAATSWTFDDLTYGALTVQPLANGDATVYGYWSGSTFGATDNHFMAQAAAISDAANPFTAMYTELKEHPDNLGEVIAFIPSNLRTAVMALTGFVDYDFDGNVTVDPTLTRIVGRPNMANMPGTLLGYDTTSRVWIVEWTVLPDNYIVAVTGNGPRALGMRQDPDPSLQGFFQAATREDYPFWEAQYVRMAGFGGWNRTAAVICRIGNASYAAPADYALPAR